MSDTKESKKILNRQYRIKSVLIDILGLSMGILISNLLVIYLRPLWLSYLLMVVICLIIGIVFGIIGLKIKRKHETDLNKLKDLEYNI